MARAAKMTRVRRINHKVKPLGMADVQVIVDNLELPQVVDNKVIWTRPSNFWIPLIGLFTGMRKSEICQLHKANIIEKDGVSSIQVSDKKAGQSLKFSSSHRHVPIHSKLVELGFLRFVAESQKGPLFPEIYRAGSQQGENWRWYNRVISPLLTAETRGFYSLRYTFATQLASKAVPLEHITRLLGRTYESTAHKFILPGMSTYKEAVEKVEYEKEITGEVEYAGVDFSRLVVPAS